MRVSLAFGSSVTALMLIGSAMADQAPAPGGKTATERQNRNDVQAAAVVARIAAVTQEIEQLAADATVVLPEPPAPSEAAAEGEDAPLRVGSLLQVAAVEQATTAATVPLPEDGAAGPVPAVAGSPPETAAPVNRIAKKKIAAKSEKRRHEKLAAAEAKALCVRAIGKVETGTAAWYGGKYIGRRTTSGARLDTIHPTAAHRTLPLNSLARVTNLHNGRSVVVRVTDRGPVAESLLIDMSPRAAEELQMKHAGVVPVTVEQVVEVPPDAK
jgi:rare lipoprotein A